MHVKKMFASTNNQNMQFKTIMKDHGNSFKTMTTVSVASESSHSHIRWRESPCVGAAF